MRPLPWPYRHHRIARKAKFDAEKAERHGAAPAPPAHLQGTAAAAAAASPTAAKEKKVYTSCKIRLQLKPPLSNQFDATDSVDAIFEWARTAMGQVRWASGWVGGWDRDAPGRWLCAMAVRDGCAMAVRDGWALWLGAVTVL